MGLVNSKIEKQICESEPQEEIQPSTPLTTPTKVNTDELDPRSPNAYISRTPLEVTISEIRDRTNLPLVRLLSAVSEKLENLAESDSNIFNNQTPKEKIILGIDPRSPAVDFTRTPIIISTEESDFPKKLHNKNLDKVRQSIYSTPKSGLEKTTSSECTKKSISPKLIDSSPIKLRQENYKRKSLIGLLETNIDYTETNLDDIIKNKTIISVMDPRSPSIDFHRTPIQILEKVEDGLNEVGTKGDFEEESKGSIVDDKNSQNECSVSSVSDRNIYEKVNEEETCELLDDNLHENNPSIPENIDTEIESRSAPVTPPEIVRPISPILAEKQTKSAPATPPMVNITANVKELDKKLTNLIYEDEDIVVCPRIVKLKDTVVRSPLRNCNGNEPMKPKLKVSDKPRKLDYAVSKIPVFRDKVRRGDIQCENTPPRNRDVKKVKARKSHWDNGDNTLYL
nr:uncharacterized protein LOC111509088 isoform X1 [Leptinotarsa decemlineata]